MWWKNYSAILSNWKGDIISLPSLQEIFPTIFSSETVILSCLIFVLKTILFKTFFVWGSQWEYWKKYFSESIRGHPFMTSTKNDQFFEPPTPTICKNEQQIYFLKTIESANLWQISRFPHPPFHVDIVNVWSLTFSPCCLTIKRWTYCGVYTC